jgi:hypothetical protein
MKIQELFEEHKGKVSKDKKYYGVVICGNKSIELTFKRYPTWNDAVDAADKWNVKNNWHGETDAMTGEELVKKWPNKFELL